MESKKCGGFDQRGHAVVAPPSVAEMEKILNERPEHPCTQLFTNAANLGSITAVRKLLEPDSNATVCPHEYFLKALRLASWRKDIDAMKTLLQAVHNESPRLYNSAAFELAIQNDQHEEVKRLQQANKFLEKVLRDKIGYFHDAAGCGDIEMVKFLLGIEVDVNADLRKIVDYQTALAVAAARGHLNMVEHLISMGSRINPPSCHARWAPSSNRSYWDRTPLTAASEEGFLGVVDMLLRAGANVDGDLALYAAASKGHLFVVRRLVEAGADVEFGVERHAALRGNIISPLEGAAQGGHIDMIDALLEANADASAEALYAASNHGFIAIVERLIDAGANVNAWAKTHGNDQTALHGASQMGRVEIVDLLIQSGAKVKPLKSSAGQNTSPLKLAIKGGHLPTARRLIQTIELNSQNESLHFVDALHAAVEQGYETIVKGLLETGTPAIDTRDEHKLLVRTAAAKGFTSIVRLLLDAGASMDGAGGNNWYGWLQTALQAAVKGGHIDTARLLLSTGADVNNAPSSIALPLHLAAKKRSIRMVQLLLDAGANVHSVSYEGETVYQIASATGQLDFLDERIRKISQNQEFDPSLHVSSVLKRKICPKCEKIPFEAFHSPSRKTDNEHFFNSPNGNKWEEEHFFIPKNRNKWTGWRPSLADLIVSARSGCPFCMFFWKQLGITKISIPPSSVVDFTRTSMNPGTISCSIQERYPRDIERPRQLSASFCVGVEPFEDGPVPVPGDTSSLKTVGQIQSWLQQCFQTHRTCLAHSDSKFLPTRLLDLTHWGTSQRLRLVESKQVQDGARYIALSHRWDAKITASTSTTSANLALRLNLILARDLPTTFLHAADVTTNLGINYLWIDSFCIIQDSVDDWAHESSLMSQIYQNSYCTISAGTTDDSSRGLFHLTDVNNDSIEFRCSSSNSGSRLVRATKKYPGWQELYEEGPLHKRGWIMQERELSPRILHYTKSQVIWECRTLKATEDWPTKNAIEMLSLKNRRILDSITTLGNHDIYNLWHHTITNYTSRQLTKTEDTLPALSGLARIVGEYTRSEYVVGLWAGDFIRTLGWVSAHSGVDTYVYGRKKIEYSLSRHDNYVAPTWSWASVVGPKIFCADEKGPSDVPNSALVSSNTQNPSERGMLVIGKYKVELATSNPYGQIKSARLHLSTPIIQGVLRYTATRGSGGVYGPDFMLDDSYGHSMGRLYFDVPSEDGGIQIVHCISLFPDRSKPRMEASGMGLALVPVDGEQATYRRVGHIQKFSHKIFADLPEERIVLI